MTYPGNPSLSSDVQQRIRSTFEHTLGLAAGGSQQEALLGCDFVLRMDPHFEPARRLQERLNAGQGPVAVRDIEEIRRLLQGGQAPGAAPAGVATPAGPGESIASPQPAATGFAFGHEGAEAFDLEGLDLELPPELPPARPADLRGELETLLQQRRFQELLSHANEVSSAVDADPELARLATLAQERLEAAPYVNRFLSAASDARRRGDAGEAARLTEKARSLDPTHPGLHEMAGAPPARADLPFTPGDSTMATQAIPAGLAAPSPSALGSHQGADVESEARIKQLLDEGQAALDAGDPQAAIDSWSRIFLIDIDHQEASRRIELARRAKAESERQVEEIYHDAMGRLEKGDLAGARQGFAQILKVQPGHLASRDYLQQIDSGIVPAPAAQAGRQGLRPATPARQPAADGGVKLPPLPAGVVRAPAGIGAKEAGEELKEEILVPPDIDQGGRSGRGSAGTSRSAETREARGPRLQDGRTARRKFLIVGSAVLLLVAAVVLFVYQRRDQWFPNSQSEETPSTALPASDPIARAKRLHDSGKTTIALAQLRRIPASDPRFHEAQKLLGEWDRAGGSGTPAASAGPPGPGSLSAGAAGGASLSGTPGPALASLPPLAPDIAARRDGLLAEARTAYSEHRHLAALQCFDQAAALQKLSDADGTQLAGAQQRLAPLAHQIDLFRQHEWEMALPDLWRMHEADPSNRDVVQLIADSYYDLALRDLQRNDPAKAAASIQEALNLNTGDRFLQRQLSFARTYQERTPDLLYQIYIKYLPMR